MSSEILNIGTSGMLAQGRGMAVIGNNIANSRTYGFKRGNLSFAEAYYGPSGSSANGLLQQRGQGVEPAGVTSDWDAAAAEDTGVMTHVAVLGDGFLPVKQGDQVAYTRAGDFAFHQQKAPAAGQPGEYVLMRPGGAVLLDATNQVVKLTEVPTDMQIKPDGTAEVSYADGTVATFQVGVQRFANPDSLRRLEGGLYAATAATVRTTDSPQTPGVGGCGYLRQGALEQSNVDLVKEFADMIACQRAFQANSRTITTADTMLQEILQLKR